MRDESVSPKAFNLIEVVVAVGIFALGMIAVIGLFAPLARSAGASSDAGAAARMADALQAKLGTMTFDEIEARLKNADAPALAATDARPGDDVARDAQLLFANRDGTKIGGYTDPVWLDPDTARASDREKFFEIALIRNETLSPQNSTPGHPAPIAIAYVARLRWPAFVVDGQGRTVQAGAGQKQVLFLAGAAIR